jgi:hypothetical protein
LLTSTNLKGPYVVITASSPYIQPPTEPQRFSCWLTVKDGPAELCQLRAADRLGLLRLITRPGQSHQPPMTAQVQTNIPTRCSRALR